MILRNVLVPGLVGILAGSVPPPQRSAHPVGERGSPAVLHAIDAEVRPYGVTEEDGYVRRVIYLSEGRYLTDYRHEDEAKTIVVDYQDSNKDEFANGVQVWIDRETGTRLIIRKAWLRYTDQIMLKYGLDLTECKRTVARDRKRYYVCYQMQPPAPTVSLLGGGYIVTLDARTGKQIGPITIGGIAPVVPPAAD